MGDTSLEQFRQFFIQGHGLAAGGHFVALGLQPRTIEKGWAEMDLPWREDLVGDPGSGVIAGGPLTALMDTCCAIAAATAGDRINFCPTLDLRMDHMGKPDPGKTLRARAEAYRVTSSVIFTRGIIYQDDPERPVVHGLANFTPVNFLIAPVQRAGDEEQSS